MNIDDTRAWDEADKRAKRWPKLVYIAGPYRATTPWDVEQNVRRAEALGYEVAKLGAYPVIPHTNTRGHFEGLPHPPEFWLGGTLELMRRCDAVVTVAAWQSSSGARAEVNDARLAGLPVFHHLPELVTWLARRPS